MTWLSDLLAEMAAVGLAPADGVVADDALHRFRVEGDRPGTRNGWYVAHADGVPAAAFGSWRTGEQHRWNAGRSGEVQQLDRESITAQRRVRAEAERAAYASAAKRAWRVWSGASLPEYSHPYLRGKAIAPSGARELDGSLIIPMRDWRGKLHSVQYIRPDGDKRFLPGGRTKGMFHTIGARTKRTWLVEGFATGASLHEDRNECVAVAFSCHNLDSVADAILRHWRPESLVIMADDDWKTPGNPGFTAAEVVATKHRIEWYFPEFPPNRPAWATDYNDAKRLWLTARRSA